MQESGIERKIKGQPSWFIYRAARVVCLVATCS